MSSWSDAWKLQASLLGSTPLACPPVPLDYAPPKRPCEEADGATFGHAGAASSPCTVLQRALERSHKNVLYAFQHVTMAIRRKARHSKQVVRSAESHFSILLEALEAARLLICAMCLAPCWQPSGGAVEVITGACMALTTHLERAGAPPMPIGVCGGSDPPSPSLVWQPFFNVLAEVQAVAHNWVDKWGWAEEFDGPAAQPGDLFYPASFSPAGLCNLSALRIATGSSPIYLGELVGDRPWRDLSGFLVKHLSMPKLLRLVSKQSPLSWRLVNLGAHRGECLHGPPWDPANCLVLHGLGADWLDGKKAINTNAHRHPDDAGGLYGGVLLDADPVALSSLPQNIAERPDVVVMAAVVAPANVSSVLSAAWKQLPENGHTGGSNLGDVDVVKVDVDTQQCDLVRAMVHGSPRILPKVFHVEFSRFHPPPLAPRTDSPNSDGSTLACFLDALGSSYGFLHAEFYNAVFVRHDLLAAIPHARDLSDAMKWQVGYFCHPLARILHAEQSEWLYNRIGVDVRAWADSALPLTSRMKWATDLEEMLNFPSGR